MFSDTSSRVELCVNLCETARPNSTPEELEYLIGETCQKAGFPYCERIYVGSYFCENFFCWMSDAFHDSVRWFCERHDVRATLVIPLAGQAFLERVDHRVEEVLDRFGDIYDEVVVNDVARFHDVQARFGKRVGLGRLFSKEMRDRRIPELMDRCAVPALSAEAHECLMAASQPDAVAGPIVELDPIADVVDVSGILAEVPQATIAMHLPLCFATTGRNCGPASIDEPVQEKFRLGRGCSQHCLRIDQGYLTDEGVRYMKHGRTFFFENPGCAILGAPSWRVVYQAGLE